MTTLRLLGTTALVLSGLSVAAAQTGTGTIADTANIAVVGTFSNMRYTEEHAYGYTIRLWRVDRQLVGFLERSQGLQGDTPIGELKDVRHDIGSGKLSFTAKLSAGLVKVDSSSDWEPARDLFTFDGHFEPGVITGVITRADQTMKTPEREDVVLPSSQEEADRAGVLVDAPTTYGEWRKRWQRVLEFRGPKW